MRYSKILLPIIFITTIACKPASTEKSTQRLDSALINTEDSWKLISPSTGSECELFLSFYNDNKVNMNFRGESFEGYYEIDSVLSQYLIVNFFKKQTRYNICSITPEYLSLFEGDTQFSYTIVGSKLYFQKAEKAIVFERVEN